MHSELLIKTFESSFEDICKTTYDLYKINSQETDDESKLREYFKLHKGNPDDNIILMDIFIDAYLMCNTFNRLTDDFKNEFARGFIENTYNIKIDSMDEIIDYATAFACHILKDKYNYDVMNFLNKSAMFIGPRYVDFFKEMNYVDFTICTSHCRELLKYVIKKKVEPGYTIRDFVIDWFVNESENKDISNPKLWKYNLSILRNAYARTDKDDLIELITIQKNSFGNNNVIYLAQILNNIDDFISGLDNIIKQNNNYFAGLISDLKKITKGRKDIPPVMPNLNINKWDIDSNKWNEYDKYLMPVYDDTDISQVDKFINESIKIIYQSLEPAINNYNTIDEYKKYIREKYKKSPTLDGYICVFIKNTFINASNEYKEILFNFFNKMNRKLEKSEISIEKFSNFLYNYDNIIPEDCKDLTPYILGDDYIYKDIIKSFTAIEKYIAEESFIGKISYPYYLLRQEGLDKNEAFKQIIRNNISKYLKSDDFSYKEFEEYIDYSPMGRSSRDYMKKEDIESLKNISALCKMTSGFVERIIKYNDDLFECINKLEDNKQKLFEEMKDMKVSILTPPGKKDENKNFKYYAKKYTGAESLGLEEKYGIEVTIGYILFVTVLAITVVLFVIYIIGVLIAIPFAIKMERKRAEIMGREYRASKAFLLSLRSYMLPIQYYIK